MEKYIQQLLNDIADATNNVSLPFVEQELSLQQWMSNEEEEAKAPVRNLQEWTGISSEMLPPQEMLGDEQVKQLLAAPVKMLDAYNRQFCFANTGSGAHSV